MGELGQLWDSVPPETNTMCTDFAGANFAIRLVSALSKDPVQRLPIGQALNKLARLPVECFIVIPRCSVPNRSTVPILAFPLRPNLGCVRAEGVAREFPIHSSRRVNRHSIDSSDQLYWAIKNSVTSRDAQTRIWPARHCDNINVLDDRDSLREFSRKRRNRVGLWV